ncbi:Peptidoglycan/LPS O-acetylase OafA/YrhL, contains acyltransferase and SGNH-hydrolase domains [Chitinophaga terrae (ex Kim and Jung 2007)]|uniref:Peptidoglycan/LPS O-acetylase OafA/YrhL, contains acyltransferase and SGNH-hydrolase domains n=1 Tax=Chitinophaga terrae (ex Kim and Jung 2007) TaxID=408074 RepID=A0A1H4FE44_9BACT|nr:acyltransferase [Chitinophaga terrae (ex Kim and Jung 2007)]GEP92404.1 acyltransferase [Chitinophaga terrae (ex Kim and Jung 2007)]SEA95545.1 Peptidoglycan/LPS O-acetylase OafA/YrhL, contains acyltransferase and SGNH-hydrolase domains [Chitinophaga terrae (ex Kim and Jung 2007)]
MKKLNSIQFLRAFAILLLIYAGAIQLASTFAKSQQQQFFHLRYFGFMGLDLFMVIAGFMTGYSFYYYSGKKDGIEFLKNRFLRINPLYYIGTLIFMVFVCFLHKNFPFVLVLSGLRDMFLPFRVLNAQQQFYLLLVDSWPFTFLWLFYILFALTIFFRIKKKLLVLGLLLLVLSIAGFYITAYVQFRAKYVTSPIMLEYLSGLLIYWLYRERKIPGYAATAFLILGVAGYIYNIFFGDNDIFRTKGDLDQIYELRHVLLMGVPAVMLVAGCIEMERNGKLMPVWNNRWFLLTGNAAYSIFLVYPTVYFLLIMGYIQIGKAPNPDLNIWLHMPIAWGLGILFYRKVEIPLLAMFETPHTPTTYANA